MLLNLLALLNQGVNQTQLIKLLDSMPMGNKSIISSLGLVLVIFVFEDNKVLFLAQNLPLYQVQKKILHDLVNISQYYLSRKKV